MSEVKTRWKTIRDTFIRNIKKKTLPKVEKKTKRKKEHAVTKLIMDQCKFLRKVESLEQATNVCESIDHYALSLEELNTPVLELNDDKKDVTNSLYNLNTVQAKCIDDCEIPIIIIDEKSDLLIDPASADCLNNCKNIDEGEVLDRGKKIYNSSPSTQPKNDQVSKTQVSIKKMCNSSSSTQSESIDEFQEISPLITHKKNECSGSNLMAVENTSELLDYMNTVYYDSSQSPQQWQQNLLDLANHPEVQAKSTDIFNYVYIQNDVSCNKDTEPRPKAAKVPPKVIDTTLLTRPKSSHQEGNCAERTIIVDCLLEMSAGRRAQALAKLMCIGKKYNLGRSE